MQTKEDCTIRDGIETGLNIANKSYRSETIGVSITNSIVHHAFCNL